MPIPNGIMGQLSTAQLEILANRVLDLPKLLAI